jgi:transcriptional regulator with XRE-family HTH domain
MTDLRQLLAENIKRFRKKLGLSQSKLAEKANTSTHYIGMIEIGRHFPTAEMLENIACALEIDTPELFSMPPASEKALKQLYAAILPEMRQAANDAIEHALKQVLNRYIEKLLPAEDGRHRIRQEGRRHM